MKKCACYVRVSTENQLENYSIKEQTERLKAYCKARDLTIINIYTDGGYSGSNINRPALQQMLKDITLEYIDTVIVYKLDRLSRSQKDTLLLIEDKFLANHIDFISVNENFDTSTPFGRAMIGILSVFAQLEKDQITERFTMGRVGRAKNGYFHGGGYAPTGYDYIDGNLIINEYEAMQIKELYARFVSGHTVHDCWKYMQNKYTTKYGAWKSEALIYHILQNDIYIGKVKFKGISYQGNHTPIISQELFDQVQNIFKTSKKNMSILKHPPFKASTLLSGLLYCGKCGAKFHGEHGNYACYSRTKGDSKYIIDPNCKNKKWKIVDLDQLIINFISRFQFSELEPIISAQPNYKNDLIIQIKDLDKQIEKLVDLYQIGNIPFDFISKKMNRLIKEKNTLQEYTISDENVKPIIEDIKETKDRFLALLSYGDLQQKRYCLSILIEQIIVDDEIINIKLKQYENS